MKLLPGQYGDEGEIDYQITLTYRCLNCGGVMHIDSDDEECIKIDPSFLAFAMGKSGAVVLNPHNISHLCNNGNGSTTKVVGSAEFRYATIMRR